ncbi:MAG TPA: hypothetical protein EYP43_03020, partial [Thermoplasmata archaeon]|nr:hypothetical protein [Thermoplasmata archaeon]
MTERYRGVNMGRSTLVMFMLLGLVMMGLVAMTGAAVAGDLEVLDIGFRPVEGLYAGQSLRIYTNVTNNGTEVNSSQVDFYMEEEIIGQMNAQNMMPGETRNLYLDYKTNKADSGSHTFKVKLTEEDENNQNNEKQDNYYINPATPDLVPSDITFDRDLIVDTYVTMTVTVENSGTDLATQVDVKVLQDTTTLTRVNVGNIAEGTSKDVELSFVLESVGTFEFRVQVDYEDRIDEINETNNEISVEEKVAAPGTDDHPDFEPTVLEWPASYVRGQEVDMEVRVWNNGTRGWSNRSVVVALMVNGTIVSETNASMPANYYDEVVLSWRIMEEEGNHTLSVVVDPDDEVEEADEGNNDVQTDIEIRPPLPDDHPDLAISADDIDFSVGGEYINESGAAIDGNDVMIMITVRNLGNMTAMDVPLDIFIDDKWYLNRTIDVNGLWDPPAQKTVVVHWTAIQGNHTIGVWLDQNRSGAVNETDGKGNMRRENNYAERALRVVEGPLPEFAIDSSQMTLEVEGAPVEQVEENTTVNLTVEVWNHGEVSGTTSIHIFDSDVPAPQNISGPLLAKYVREINAGDKVVVGIDWTINRTGVHYIRAIALNGTGSDMDFSNNEGQVSVTVVGEPLPDLMVTDLWLNESAPLRNESVLIRFDVKNNGTADATDHFQVLFTIVGEREDIIGTMWQNSTIFPNETRTLSYVWDINFFVPGVYTLKVQLDPRSGGGHGNVREFDEGNNEATVNITIRALHAPDVGIRPDAIRISPAWDPMGGKWMNNTPAVQRPDLAIISGR